MLKLSSSKSLPFPFPPSVSSTVYLSIRLSDMKDVIIKQIPVEQMTKEERQVALNEAKVLAMLDHPNIIKYYENYLEDKALMIVMEYAQGGTVFEYLQQRGKALLDEEVKYRTRVLARDPSTRLLDGYTTSGRVKKENKL